MKQIYPRKYILISILTIIILNLFLFDSISIDNPATLSYRSRYIRDTTGEVISFSYSYYDRISYQEFDNPKIILLSKIHYQIGMNFSTLNDTEYSESINVGANFPTYIDNLYLNFKILVRDGSKILLDFNISKSWNIGDKPIEYRKDVYLNVPDPVLYQSTKTFLRVDYQLVINSTLGTKNTLFSFGSRDILDEPPNLVIYQSNAIPFTFTLLLIAAVIPVVYNNSLKYRIKTKQ